jgi:transcription elongation factor S-II
MLFVSNDDSVRNKHVILMNKEFNNETLSRLIEQQLYNVSIRVAKERFIRRRWDNPLFKQLYISKIRSFYSNIASDSYVSNNNFKTKIMNGGIKIEQISELSVYDICPENWAELLDKKIKRDKIKYEIKPTAMTDQYKCRKCSSRSCSYYEVQTRSADEPMTQFITCLDCDNRWKQ